MGFGREKVAVDLIGRGNVNARRLFLFHVPFFLSRDIMPQPVKNR